MSKVRNKKYNPSKAPRKAFELYRERFWLVGAHCLPNVAMGGMVEGYVGVKQMKDSFKNLHYWRGFALVFQTDGVSRWVDSVYLEANVPITARDFNPFVDIAQEKILNAVNSRWVTCVGYICTISKTAIMDCMLDDAIEFLTSKGAFNYKWCLECRALRE